MTKYRTVKDYSSDSDNDVLVLTDVVINGLTGSAVFTSPDPPLAALTDLRNEFSDSIIAAIQGGTQLIAVRKEKRSELVDALQREAIYVDLKGQNTESILLTSGFKIYSSAHGVTPLSGTPIFKGAKDGSVSGEIVLRLFSVKYAVVYELRYTTDEYSANARWTYLVCQTKPTFLLTGLSSLTRYWFEARTISTKGPSGWSEPFRFVVR